MVVWARRRARGTARTCGRSRCFVGGIADRRRARRGDRRNRRAADGVPDRLRAADRHLIAVARRDGVAAGGVGGKSEHYDFAGGCWDLGDALLQRLLLQAPEWSGRPVRGTDAAQAQAWPAIATAQPHADLGADWLRQDARRLLWALDRAWPPRRTGGGNRPRLVAAEGALLRRREEPARPSRGIGAAVQVDLRMATRRRRTVRLVATPRTSSSRPRSRLPAAGQPGGEGTRGRRAGDH